MNLHDFYIYSLFCISRDAYDSIVRCFDYRNLKDIFRYYDNKLKDFMIICKTDSRLTDDEYKSLNELKNTSIMNIKNIINKYFEDFDIDSLYYIE